MNVILSEAQRHQRDAKVRGESFPGPLMGSVLAPLDPPELLGSDPHPARDGRGPIEAATAILLEQAAQLADPVGVRRIGDGHRDNGTMGENGHTREG